jgi:uncharacterized membrane protein (UPF0182 family)
VRAPQDLPAPRARTRRLRPRGRWWIAVVVVVVIVAFASLKSLSTLYTDNLWFSSVHQHRVWSTLLAVKVGLFASFGAAFFAVLWANLLVCDRLAEPAGADQPEDELVRRFRRIVGPYSGRIYAAVALVVALIAASGTIGQWKNWILFRHGGSFGVADPQFHADVGFFVFKLPFLSFLVSWSLASLVVILVITAIVHYLNGGIRPQRAAPRVRPAVKAHLSVLLALIALAKAAGYLLARYQLDLSHNGYVEGAGYTDVNARVPALWLLFWISLAAAIVLLYNIRQRGWTLPVLAVGVWAFVALVVGVIYPALLQVLKVNPAQSTLERPYIQRNIAATRAAYALNGVVTQDFAGTQTITPTAVAANLPTLSNIRLWDPDPTISLGTFQKLQYIRSYYAFQSVMVDRYSVNGQLEPAMVGVRQLNSSAVPSSWVNGHLQYTHGEGLVLAQANQATSGGNPSFGIQNVPSQSGPGLPRITQSAVYFGLQSPGYVVANTRQLELDYQRGGGSNVESHYASTGGVRVGSWFAKAAFAVRLGDFNLLISNLVTPDSRIIFVRDVQQMAQKAAPFLHYDNDPYAAVVGGHIDWILDAYTATNEYPYSQGVDTTQVPPGSGLPANYNYVRNSVKVVIDAYTGKMTFYDMTTRSARDPILAAYEGAFPQMFTPFTAMSPALKAHLRYPEDLFSVQAATYGRYHITDPAQFFTAGSNGGDAWSLSPTAGVGSPSNALAVTPIVNARGEITGTPPQRMAPLYQVLAQPGQSRQSFTISDAYVPASQGNQVQNLSAFIMSDGYGQPGQLKVFRTPQGQSVPGPAQADSRIQQTQSVSKQISLLDQRGSNVVLGNILMIPIDQSMLYLRPLYVESQGNPQPQLQDVIAVFGQNVFMEPTLDAALSDVFGTPVVTGTVPVGPTPVVGGSGGAPSALQTQIAAHLAQAVADFQAAQAALKSGLPGSLGTFESDIEAMNQEVQAAQALIAGAAATAPTTGTTTTTTPAKRATVRTASTTTTAPASST